MGSLSLPTSVTAEGIAGLDALRAEPRRALVAFDFDGTLAPIVPDPEQARAHPGAVPALAALAPKVCSVAVITGRPAAVAVEYCGLAGVPGLEHLVVLGHYGAERWDAATGEVRTPGDHPGVRAAQAELPAVLAGVDGDRAGGAFVERKGGRAVAVHTRRTSDPQAALEALRGPMAELAARHGLVVEPGRMVLELRPPGVDKGAALTAEVHRTGARSVLYAGDDLGDLAAFDAVDELRAQGVPGVLVCSGSTEVPELAARADLTVDGPAGVVAFVRALVAALA